MNDMNYCSGKQGAFTGLRFLHSTGQVKRQHLGKLWTPA